MNNDLIRREALIKKFLHAMCHNCGDPHKEYICGICQIGAAVNLIKSAPAVDAVEVVHAKWENGVCVSCKFDLRCLKYGENDLEQWVWDEGLDYCPNCGARMDGE